MLLALWLHKRLIKVTPMGFTIEIIEAYEMVSSVVRQLSDFRSNNVKEFQSTLEKSKDMLNIFPIKSEVPKAASRQTLRGNVERFHRRIL